MKFVRISAALLAVGSVWSLACSSAAPLSVSQQAEVVESVKRVMENEIYDKAVARQYVDALDKFERHGLRDGVESGEFAITVHRVLQRVLTDYHLSVFGPARTVSAEHHDEDEEAGHAHSASEAMSIIAEERGVKLIKLNGFLAEANDIRAMYAALRGVESAPAVIFDLRGNAGGDSTLARLMLGCLIKEPKELYSIHIPHGQYARHSVYESEPNAECGNLYDMPLAVLVDHNTASTAELFALILQNRQRAVVIGEATAGGGHAAEYFPLAHGFAMLAPIGTVTDRLTGEGWEGTGVIPDVEVKPIDARMRAIDMFCNAGIL